LAQPARRSPSGPVAIPGDLLGRAGVEGVEGDQRVGGEKMVGIDLYSAIKTEHYPRESVK
jgi:hypothetical protein